MALEYASKRLQSDKEIVKIAVTKLGKSIQFANKDLQGDKEIALLAVHSDKTAVEYIKYSLLKDKRFVIDMLNKQPELLKYISKELRADEKIVTDVLKRNKGLVKYASDEIKIKYQALESNNFQRNFKEGAWKSFTIREIESELYASDIKFLSDKKIRFRVSDMGTPINPISILVRSKYKMKSISILQKSSGEDSLIAFFSLSGKKFETEIAYKNKENMSYNEIIIIVETKDGKFYKYIQRVDEPMCIYDNSEAGEEYRMIEKQLRAKENLKYIIENMEFKIRKKYTVMFLSMLYPMSVDDFITHIQGKVKNKVVFDIYSNNFFPKKLKFRMILDAVKKDNTLDITFTDNQGKDFTESFIIK
ncbi:MAG: DUF4116 domain-containing protein [Sulfurovum sp.]|nr:DUF4116 domain-containing protein [Sulfurovum sp.]